MSIVAFRAGMFAKRAEASSAGLVVFNDQEKHPRSNQSKGFAGLGKGQKRLTKCQKKGGS